jgi:hypothetical protein
MTITVNGPNGVVINFPDGTDNATIDQAMRQAAGVGEAPKGFMANAADFFKSIPRGVVSGLTSAPNPSMVPGLEPETEAVAPTRERALQTLQAPLPAPQGPAGQFGQAMGEGLGNPMSYLGPGSMGLKLGGAALSSLGSEGGRQAAQGTPLEAPASVAGALLGGTAAYKALGPTAPKAAIPTGKELLKSGAAGYKANRKSGLEVAPEGMSSWALKVEQELMGPEHGFKGGQFGTAPRTLAALGELSATPVAGAGERALFTASDLHGLRKHLGKLAKETKDFKPTEDAAAASIALKRLDEFAEGDIKNFTLAGDAEDYVRTAQRANADYAAGKRTKEVESRITKAHRKTDEQPAGSIDRQLKAKLGQLQDNEVKTRGYNEAELGQLDVARRGTTGSNILQQFGRGGAGVIPLMGQMAAVPVVGAAAGPLGLIAQALIAGGLYGARKGSEAITKGRAKKLTEMLAKRSPLYEERVKNLPPPDTSPGTAAIIRALLNAQ